jgi:hypothetical protein
MARSSNLSGRAIKSTICRVPGCRTNRSVPESSPTHHVRRQDPLHKTNPTVVLFTRAQVESDLFCLEGQFTRQPFWRLRSYRMPGRLSVRLALSAFARQATRTPRLWSSVSAGRTDPQ